ncbi:MAG: alcohol dehydrogenase catalytic domain-containing protein [Rikenellaceae bacterium]
MKASYYEGNKTFSVKEKELIAPAAGEVRIKVAYCGICGSDVHIYHGTMDSRVSIPQTIGHEMSGEIDAIGEGVEGYAVGDKIVVRPLDNRLEDASDKGFSHICKKLKFMGIDSEGALQQFWNVPSFVLHKLPSTIDLKLASLIEPLAVACHDVRRSGLREGEVTVVLGGGPIGALVAMVARTTGAKVIISEMNPTRIELLRGMGFDVVSPAETNLLEYVTEVSNGSLADVVFEVAGVQATINTMTEIAGLCARIVVVAIHAQPKPIDLKMMFWRELSVLGARLYEPQDYEKAIAFTNSGELPLEPLITNVMPLDKIQDIFEEIVNNPSGMKFLIDCQA